MESWRMNLKFVHGGYVYTRGRIIFNIFCCGISCVALNSILSSVHVWKQADGNPYVCALAEQLSH
jgi:hypothetical protein